MIDVLVSLLTLLVVWVALPLTWFASWRLWLLHRRRMELKVLRERGIAMTMLALLVTVFAVVFINNDFEVPPLDVATTRILTRGALFLFSVVPACYWLWLYRSGK